MSTCARFAIVLALTFGALTGITQASVHDISVGEIYSNCDGSKQFIELYARSEFQTQLQQARLTSRNANGAVETVIFDFTASFPALNATETILLATSAMQTDLGFTADFTIPANSIPLNAGRIIFRFDAGTLIDAVAYGAYTGSNTNYGTPAAAIPTLDCMSLTNDTLKLAPPARNNSIDWSLQSPTPKKNNGTTGSITCPPPSAPVQAAIGPKNVNENQLLSFSVSATDPNCDPVTYSVMNLPPGATFNPNGDPNSANSSSAVGSFSWTPTFVQSGMYPVLFISSDGTFADSEIVTITVNEVTNPPIAMCQNVQANANAMCQGVVAASEVNSGSSDPEGGGLTFQLQPPGPFALGNTNVSLIVTDPAGATDTCAATITVVDNSPPVMTCPNDTTASVPEGETEKVVEYELPHTNENCGAPSISCNPPSGSTFPLGTTTVTCIVTDNAGLADTCIFEVTVVESQCACDCHADPAPVGACDGLPTVLDVSQLINVAFRAAAPIPDPNANCPYETTDVNCDNVTTILDVSRMINVAFRAGNPATEFCDPCP